MKNKNGFTLIELLAVVIILGILMIIAVPSVTKYINDTRRNSYVSIAKKLVDGVRNIANSDRLKMNDRNTTYYIPSEYVKTENNKRSPYGEFTEAYIGVVLNDKGYKYYWVSRDSMGIGVKDITLIDKLETDDLEEDIPTDEITGKVRTIGVGNRSIIKILNSSNETWETIELSDTSNNVGETGGSNTSIPVATTIASCEDCVYIYTTNTLNFGTNGSVLQASDYDTNYLNVVESTGRFFFGVKLNQSTNRIEKAYVCGLDSGNSNAPFCIEGIRDNSSNTDTIFASNANLVERMSFGSTCYRGTNHIDCMTSVSDYVFSEKNSSNPWEVSIYRNVGYDMEGCFIIGDGTLFCGIR